MTSRTLLVVSDVDGTIIDSEGRAPCTAAALNAQLERVARAHGARCSLAFASSRTLAELVVLQRGLGVRGPCIAEDGAILAIDLADAPHGVIPGSTSAEWHAGRRTFTVWNLGDSAATLRAELGDVISPYELDTDNSAAMAGFGFRSPGALRRALTQRGASILLDLRSVGRQREVRDAAAQANAHLHCGGRWHTLTRGAGKGTATNLLRGLLTHEGDTLLRVIGIGNEENDASLLTSADVSFAIRNATGVHPALAAVKGTVQLNAVGTAGFLEMLERVAEMPVFEEPVQ